MESLTKSLPLLVQPLKVDYDYLWYNHRDYLKVPKDIRKNLLFRRKVVEFCINNEEYAKEIRRTCKKDILFYLNTFAWTYNPKNVPGLKVLPFISYEFQDYFIIELVKAIFEGHDILGEKSRDMGATWMVIYVGEWLWHFYGMESGLFVSRTEDYVEDPGNPKALFWKFDFHTDHLPMFLKPVIQKTDMHRKNQINGSVIDGESTTGNVARGDRRTFIFLDEFAAVKEGQQVLTSTRDATNCRIFVSTPQGCEGAFSDMAQTDIKKVTMHWSLHPEKAAGLYRYNRGDLEIIDKQYKFPEGYRFIQRGDGKWSSPWYDIQRKRCASDREAAQELDINYFGSGDQFFDTSFLKQTYLPRHCVPPWFEGELVIDDEDTLQCHFEERPGGKLKLWMILENDGRPLENEMYGEAADISAGTGASNSVISIGNFKTKEKVAEWADNHTSPEDCAKVAVCLAIFFNRAYMIWEMNGPGHIFCNKVVDKYYYDNIYYRQNDTSITKKVTDLPGWWSTGDSKNALLGTYRSGLASETFINHSEPAVKETFQYVYTKSGVEHSSTQNSSEDSGTKKHHGDRVIADALLHKLFEQCADLIKEEEPERPNDCVQSRRDAALRNQKKDNDGW